MEWIVNKDNMWFLNLLVLVLTFLSIGYSLSQSQDTETIKGYAPSYVGQEVKIALVEDYFSLKDSVIGSAVVQQDSSFTIDFKVSETQKMIVYAGKNRSYMYVQPHGSYTVYLPEKDKFEPYRPNGNQIELTFLDLDTLDINYKILQFQRWLDEFVSDIYLLKSIKPIEFAKKMESFKHTVDERYKISDTLIRTADNPTQYFKVFVRYTIASLDNIQTASERNRYEKHDFYIKYFPVAYRNDAYMEYLSNFYDKMLPRFSMEVSNRYYLGLLKSSPTLIMRALGQEYTLLNLRIREMIMIKSLSEAYYTQNKFPQQNILVVLDSVSKHSLFEANAIIARNMLNRLTQVVPGGKAPFFHAINAQQDSVTSDDFKGKYLYIQFVDPSSNKSMLEIKPLIKLYENYKNEIEFITVIQSDLKDSSGTFLNLIPWKKYWITQQNTMLSDYKIETFPSYVLIDNSGYIVSAPALGPLPNGQYETIEKTFFYIKKYSDELLNERNR